jgi:hypothetical protein
MPLTFTPCDGRRVRGPTCRWSSAAYAIQPQVAEDQWGLFTRQQAESTGMAWTTLARLVKNNIAERVAHGIYRLRGAPPVDHLALRAAWLQLAPGTPVWQRTARQGVISRRSAASGVLPGRWTSARDAQHEGLR